MSRLESWIRENKRVYGSDFLKWKEQEIVLLRDTLEVSDTLTEDSMTARLAVYLEAAATWKDLEQTCNRVIEEDVVRIYNMTSKDKMSSFDEILKNHKEDHAISIWLLNSSLEDDVFGITSHIVAEKLGMEDLY